MAKLPERNWPRNTQKWQTPRMRSGAFDRLCSDALAAIAEQPQQHQEQVDEVEIESERAHYGLAAADRAVVHRIVHFLDRLSVIGGEPGEHEHTDDRDRPREPTRMQENVDQAGDDDADQAHKHE